MFSKIYDETRLPYNTAGSAGDLRSAGDSPPARAGFVRAVTLQPNLVFVTAVRKIMMETRFGRSAPRVYTAGSAWAAARAAAQDLVRRSPAVM